MGETSTSHQFLQTYEVQTEMFGPCNWQEETAVLQKQIARKLWNSFIDQYLIQKFLNICLRDYPHTKSNRNATTASKSI